MLSMFKIELVCFITARPISPVLTTKEVPKYTYFSRRTNGRAIAYWYSVASVCRLSSSSVRNVLWINGAS